MSLDTLKWVRETVWLCPHHPSPKMAQLKSKGDVLTLWLLLWAPVFPAVQEATKLGEEQIGLSEGFKRTQMPLTALLPLSRSPPTSRWEHFTHRSPQLAHGHPHRSTCLTHTPTLWPAPCAHSLPMTASRGSLDQQLVGMHGKLTEIWGPERDHKLEL